MLLYSTLLDINPQKTEEDFRKLVLRWNETHSWPQNCVKGAHWTETEKGKFGDERLWIQFEEEPVEGILAVRYEKKGTDGVVWDTDYIANFKERKLSVRLDRSFTGPCLRRIEFTTPHFVTMLAEEGWLSDDGPLPVTKKALPLDAERMPVFLDIAGGRDRCHLPLVVLSPDENGKLPLELGLLCSRLKGAAHILLDSGQVLRPKRRGDRADSHFYGAVGIFCPGQPRKMMYFRSLTGDPKERLERASAIALRYSLAQAVPDLYTWNGVMRYMIYESLEKTRQLQLASAKDLASSREELLEYTEMFDDELRHLREKIQELTNTNAVQDAELQALRIRLEERDVRPVLYQGSEEEFFPDEIRDMVLEVLEEGLKNVKEKSRRADILEDLLSSNRKGGEGEKRRQRIKQIFSDYRKMSGTMRNELKGLGFDFAEENSHYKLIYFGDQRYRTVLAKTGSDSREGKNIAGEILRGMM